jgi:hypothetical protein
MKNRTAGRSGVAQDALLRLSDAVENAPYLFGSSDGARVQQAASCICPNDPDVSVAASCGGAPAISLAASCGSDGQTISSVASCGGAPGISLAASCVTDGMTFAASCGGGGVLPEPEGE